MGAIESQEVLSETEERTGPLGTGGSDELKLVPVAESIRYRKRAQSAEQQVETLTEKLAQAKTQAGQLDEELAGVRREQELTRKLVGSGVLDLEAALLMAKARVNDQDKADLDAVIEQLKAEKRYLFAEKGTVSGAKKTSGARERLQDGRAIVESAAKKAARTGNRADLQEYLKLRRNFL